MSVVWFDQGALEPLLVAPTRDSRSGKASRGLLPPSIPALQRVQHAKARTAGNEGDVVNSML